MRQFNLERFSKLGNLIANDAVEKRGFISGFHQHGEGIGTFEASGIGSRQFNAQGADITFAGGATKTAGIGIKRQP